ESANRQQVNDEFCGGFKGKREVSAPNLGNSIRTESTDLPGKVIRSKEPRSDFSDIELVLPSTGSRIEARKILENDHVRRCPAFRNAKNYHWPCSKSIN